MFDRKALKPGEILPSPSVSSVYEAIWETDCLRVSWRKVAKGTDFSPGKELRLKFFVKYSRRSSCFLFSAMRPIAVCKEAKMRFCLKLG